MSYLKKSLKRTIPLPPDYEMIQAMDLSQSPVTNKEDNKIKNDKNECKITEDEFSDNNSNTNDNNSNNSDNLSNISNSETPMTTTTSTCSTESAKSRNPKCARCGNHGEIVAVKGHKRKCRYRECVCERCILTVDRQILMAKTIRVKRRQKEDMSDPNMTDDQRFPKPIYKKQRSDDCISETDRESGYSTNSDDSDKRKDMNAIKLNEYFAMIDNEIKELKEMIFDHNLSFADIGEELIALKNNINYFINQRIQSKNCKNVLPFDGNHTIGSSVGPTNSTPTVPMVVPLVSPPFNAYETSHLNGPNSTVSEPNNTIESDKTDIRSLFPIYYHQLLMAQKSPFYCPIPSVTPINNMNGQ
ncbi:doublesex and mab-3 related transcription factor 3-like [Oppia nitens]|uniref:doublesex and mab-3 related transcription factor 3-like n=1 Tax=Oppia nitens TaxID=1686743 RepID=UPI0023DB8A8A|nr:doublesex and mab-3 related transcription factor 3-like [Oppia nitens]